MKQPAAPQYPVAYSTIPQTQQQTQQQQQPTIPPVLPPTTTAPVISPQQLPFEPAPVPLVDPGVVLVNNDPQYPLVTSDIQPPAKKSSWRFTKPIILDSSPKIVLPHRASVTTTVVDKEVALNTYEQEKEPFLLNFFSHIGTGDRRNYTIIIDKSGSMAGSNWKDVQKALAIIIPHICSSIVWDYFPGVSVYFFSSPSASKGHPKYTNVRTKDETLDLFFIEKPNGTTDLAGVLRQVFTDHFNQAERTPESILVVTDGIPDSKNDVKSELVKLTDRIDPEEVDISVVQIGDDVKATKFLKELRTYLNETRVVQSALVIDNLWINNDTLLSTNIACYVEVSIKLHDDQVNGGFVPSDFSSTVPGFSANTVFDDYSVFLLYYRITQGLSTLSFTLFRQGAVPQQYYEIGSVRCSTDLSNPNLFGVKKVFPPYLFQERGDAITVNIQLTYPIVLTMMCSTNSTLYGFCWIEQKDTVGDIYTVTLRRQSSPDFIPEDPIRVTLLSSYTGLSNSIYFIVPTSVFPRDSYNQTHVLSYVSYPKDYAYTFDAQHPRYSQVQLVTANNVNSTFVALIGNIITPAIPIVRKNGVTTYLLRQSSISTQSIYQSDSKSLKLFDTNNVNNTLDVLAMSIEGNVYPQSNPSLVILKAIEIPAISRDLYFIVNSIPYNIPYPYGYSGNASAVGYSIVAQVNQKVFQIPAQIYKMTPATITISNVWAKRAVLVKLVEFIPFTEYSVIARITFSDTSEIRFFTLNGVYQLTPSDLVAGTLADGVLEKEIYLPLSKTFKTMLDCRDGLNSDISFMGVVNQGEPYNTRFDVVPPIPYNTLFAITLVNITSVRFSTNDINIGMEPFNLYMYFDVTNIDVSVKPRVVILSPTEPEVVFTGAYDPVRLLYRVNITLSPYSLEGPVHYKIITAISTIYDDDLVSSLGSSARLTVRSTQQPGGLIQPIVTKVTAFPATTFKFDEVSSPTLGWDITIESSLYDIGNGEAVIMSSADNIPRIIPIIIPPGTRITTYPIRFEVGHQCLDETIYIASIHINNTLNSSEQFDGVISLFGGQNEAHRSIRVTCTEYIKDITPPYLTSFVVSRDTVDVGYPDRLVEFRFSVADADTGISRRHLPIVYLTSMSEVLAATTKMIDTTGHAATYTASLDLPYGFGSSILYLSVYGITDNTLNLGAYNLFDLDTGGFRNNITRVFTTDIPVLESYVPVETNHDPAITLRGRGLSNSQDLVCMAGETRIFPTTNVSVALVFENTQSFTYPLVICVNRVQDSKSCITINHNSPFIPSINIQPTPTPTTTTTPTVSLDPDFSLLLETEDSSPSSCHSSKFSTGKIAAIAICISLFAIGVTVVSVIVVKRNKRLSKEQKSLDQKLKDYAESGWCNIRVYVELNVLPTGVTAANFSSSLRGFDAIELFDYSYSVVYLTFQVQVGSTPILFDIPGQTPQDIGTAQCKAPYYLLERKDVMMVNVEFNVDFVNVNIICASNSIVFSVCRIRNRDSTGTMYTISLARNSVPSSYPSNPILVTITSTSQSFNLSFTINPLFPRNSAATTRLISYQTYPGNYTYTPSTQHPQYSQVQYVTIENMDSLLVSQGGNVVTSAKPVLRKNGTTIYLLKQQSFSKQSISLLDTASHLIVDTNNSVAATSFDGQFTDVTLICNLSLTTFDNNLKYLVNSGPVELPYPYGYHGRNLDESIRYSTVFPVYFKTMRAEISVIGGGIFWIQISDGTFIAFPVVNKVEFIPFTSYSFIARISYTDGSGIQFFKLQSQYMLTTRDIVKGDIYNGTMEKEIYLVNTPTIAQSLLNAVNRLNFGISPAMMRETNQDTPYNAQFDTLPAIPYQSMFSITLSNITSVLFSTYDINIGVGTYNIIMYFGVTNIDVKAHPKVAILSPNEDDLVYNGAYDPSTNMYRFNITLSPYVLEGVCHYKILSTIESIYDDDLVNRLGQSARLFITSTQREGGAIDPVITKIVAVPSTQVLRGPLGSTIGWNMTIESSRFDIGTMFVDVISTRDNYVRKIPVSITSSNRTKTVAVTFQIQHACVNEVFYISSITYNYSAQQFDGVLALFGGDNEAQRSIQVICQSEQFDINPPILRSLSVSPQVIDVGQRSPIISFAFTLYEPPTETGVAERQLPMVYVTAQNGDVVVGSSDLKSSDAAAGTWTYQSSIFLPYGYGSETLLLSIYGITDNNLNFAGYTSLDLKTMGFTYFIKRVFTTNIPLLDSYEPVFQQDGTITVRGHGFGDDFSTLVSTIDYGNGAIEIYPSFNTSVALIYSDLETFTTANLCVQRAGSVKSCLSVIADSIFISPTSPPFPTAQPVTCTGTPPCSNNGECTSNGCVCVSPWAGPSCSERMYPITHQYK
eukprot:gene455-543_t